MSCFHTVTVPCGVWPGVERSSSMTPSEVFFGALVKAAEYNLGPGMHALNVTDARGPLNPTARRSFSSGLRTERTNRVSFLSANNREHGFKPIVRNSVGRSSFKNADMWQRTARSKGYQAPLFGQPLHRSKLTKALINTKRAVKSALDLHIGDR